MDPVLRDARELDGRPRFYPPGQHPATQRLRAQLASARGVQDKDPEGRRLGPGLPRAQRRRQEVYEETRRLVEYLAEQLATFEEGESIAKADYLQRYGRQQRREMR